MSHIEVEKELCKGCGLCLTACPKHVIELSDNINAKGYNYAAQCGPECIACKMCAEICPDVAITVYKTDKKKKG